MVSINDHPDIRRVFEGFYFETTEIRYTSANLRQGKAEVTGELIVMGGFGRIILRSRNKVYRARAKGTNPHPARVSILRRIKYEMSYFDVWQRSCEHLI